MKNFPMENLTELSPKELSEVQGGGLLQGTLATVARLVEGLPNVVGTVGNILKGAIDFIF
jgi:hypothetical protein